MDPRAALRLHPEQPRQAVDAAAAQQLAEAVAQPSTLLPPPIGTMRVGRAEAEVLHSS